MRVAAHAARTDPTARLCGGVGVAQELSTGLYRLVVAPREVASAASTSMVLACRLAEMSRFGIVTVPLTVDPHSVGDDLGREAVSTVRVR